MGCLTNGLSQSAVFVNHHHHHRCHHRNANCKDHNDANCTKENEFLSNNIMQSELQVGLWVFHSLFSENFVIQTPLYYASSSPINNNKEGQIGFFHASFVIFCLFALSFYANLIHSYHNPRNTVSTKSVLMYLHPT